MQESKVDLDVTSHPSGILSQSSLDVTWWRELLEHEVVMLSGTLPFSSEPGAVLFTQPIIPSRLQSQTQKSIIAHLAELFTQWNGTLVFKLVCSLPMFVATKFAFGFIPNPIEPGKINATSLAGFHNSCVYNPSTSVEAVLEIPFMSQTPWKFVDEQIGNLKAALLQPIIRTQESAGGGIPWTLFVAAKASDFHFRYIVPPTVSGGGLVADTSIPFEDQIIARAMSTTTRAAPAARANQQWPLLCQPTGSLDYQYSRMLLIPKDKVQALIWRLSNSVLEYDNVVHIGFSANTVVADMFDIPTYSDNSYQLIDFPPIQYVFPYFSGGGYLLWSYYFSADTTVQAFADLASIAVDCLNWIFYFRVSERTAAWLHSVKPSISWSPPTPDAGTQTLLNLQYSNRYMFSASANGLQYVYVAYRRASTGQAVPTYFPRPSSGTTVRWYCRSIANWLTTPNRVTNVTAILSQVSSAPSDATHIALYTDAISNSYDNFIEYLISQDSTAYCPREFVGRRLSFSPNQAQFAFANGRMDNGSDSRGLLWSVYRMYHGDDISNWWAWLVRGADLLLDYVVATTLGRATDPFSVDITPTSGFMVEAVSPDTVRDPALSPPTIRQIDDEYIANRVNFPMENWVVINPELPDDTDIDAADDLVEQLRKKAVSTEKHGTISTDAEYVVPTTAEIHEAQLADQADQLVHPERQATLLRPMDLKAVSRSSRK